MDGFGQIQEVTGSQGFKVSLMGYTYKEMVYREGSRTVGKEGDLKDLGRQGSKETIRIQDGREGRGLEEDLGRQVSIRRLEEDLGRQGGRGIYKDLEWYREGRGLEKDLGRQGMKGIRKVSRMVIK